MEQYEAVGSRRPLIFFCFLMKKSRKIFCYIKRIYYLCNIKLNPKEKKENEKQERSNREIREYDGLPDRSLYD